MIEPPLIEFRDVRKSFFGVPVLQGVTLAVARGRVLGLVGENGAGKSTLMNVLGGVHRPDSGAILLDGSPYAPRHPSDAARAGISFVHQELNLFGNLSVAANLHLRDLPRRRIAGFATPLIDRRRLHDRAREVLRAVDLAVDPATPVEGLGPGQRQLVEIAKAVAADARLIILDEPTTSLTSPEADRLFGLVRRLRDRGVSIIIISHNLRDVLDLCDDVAVLRDGHLVGAGPAAGYTEGRLIAEMIGRTPDRLYAPRLGVPSARPVLEAVGLARPPAVRGVDFTLHAGEILGVSGLMGAGRTELARLLFGLDPIRAGHIRLHGRPFAPTPRRCIRDGVAFVTEDRREEGLMMDAGVVPNASLVALPGFARTPLRLVGRPRVRAAVGEAAASVRLRAAGLDRTAARALSGGNQQKVVFAKWLIAGPSVMLLDEPTRGIDVGARHEIYRIIEALAEGGAGVLLISSEIEELIGMCDRILVMAAGRIRDEIPRAGFDRERILRAALMVPKAREPSS